VPWRLESVPMRAERHSAPSDAFGEFFASADTDAKQRIWEARLMPQIRDLTTSYARNELRKLGTGSVLDPLEIADDAFADIATWIWKQNPEAIKTLPALVKKFVVSRVSDRLRKTYPRFFAVQAGLDYVLRKPAAGSPLRLVNIGGQRHGVLVDWREPWPIAHVGRVSSLEQEPGKFLIQAGLDTKNSDYKGAKEKTLYRAQLIEGALRHVGGPVSLNSLTQLYAAARNLDLYEIPEVDHRPRATEPGEVTQLLWDVLPKLPRERRECLLLDFDLGAGEGMSSVLADRFGETALYQHVGGFGAVLERHWAELPLGVDDIGRVLELEAEAVGRHLALGRGAILEHAKGMREANS